MNYHQIYLLSSETGSKVFVLYDWSCEETSSSECNNSLYQKTKRSHHNTVRIEADSIPEQPCWHAFQRYPRITAILIHGTKSSVPASLRLLIHANNNAKKSSGMKIGDGCLAAMVATVCLEPKAVFHLRW